MINLGKKEQFGGPVETTKESKSRIYYPGFHVSNIDLGIDEEDVGKTVIATVKLKIEAAGKRIRDEKDKGVKKTEDYDFDILAIDIGKPHKKRDGRENPLQADLEDGLEDAANKKD